MLRLLAVLALGACLIIVGCGTNEEAEQAKSEAEEELVSLAEDMTMATEQFDQAEECSRQVKGLMRPLQDLDSLLGVGLSYDEYSTKVQQVAIAYNRVDFDDAEFDCLGEVGIPAETAFRQYAKAEDKWSGCIEDFGCDIDSIDPALQSHWNKAGLSFEQAEESLNQMTDKAEKKLTETEEQLEEAEEKLEQAESEL